MSNFIYDSIPVSINEDPLDKVIDKLNKAKEEARSKGAVEEPTLEIYPFDDYGSPGVDVNVQYKRSESPEEMKARLKREEDFKSARKRQYLQLKKEFEGN